MKPWQHIIPDMYLPYIVHRLPCRHCASVSKGTNPRATRGGHSVLESTCQFLDMR